MGFQLKLNRTNKVSKPKPKLAFGSEERSTKEQKKTIDGFSTKKGGALAGKVAINVKPKTPELIIVPKKLTSSLEQIDAEEANKDMGDEKKDGNEDDEKKDGKSLPYGLSMAKNRDPERDEMGKTKNLQPPLKSRDLTVSEDTEAQDYENVPVEQFGMAMLRGMGWKPTPQTNKTENTGLEARQRGMVLGIGAKAIEADLIRELNGNSRSEAPLKRKPKE